MQTKTLITIKTDPRVKEKAQKIAKEIGIPLGTFLNAQLRQLIRERSITVSLAPTMSKALERTIAIVEEDIAHDRNHSPVFTSADDAIAYLRKK